MTTSLALTKDNLSKLLCSNCKKYLSVPPINIKAGQFICGRCGSSGNRVTIYEELAKFMNFPCSNQPCPTVLKWDQVLNHETNCSYKVIGCPKPNCDLYFKALDLGQHFQTAHKGFFHHNELQIRRTLRDIPFENFNKDKLAYLLHDENQSYLVMVYGICKEDRDNPGYIYSYTYNFGVFYLYKNESTKTHYDLTVTVTDDEGEDDVHTYDNQPLIQYNSNQHCLGCLDKNCHKGHENTNLKMFLLNKLYNIENDECDLVISYSIKLVNQHVATGATSSNNVTLSSKFECPICLEFLTTPIYICANGHSLCSNCKRRVTNCALCQAHIGNSRNYVLEQISETLEICCPNATRGCSYVGKVFSTKQHMSHCRY